MFGGLGDGDELYSFGNLNQLIIILVGNRNDLWKFDGEYWTWIAGSKELDQRGMYGTQRVPGPNNIPGARDGAVSWTDSSYNVYIFGGNGYSSSGILFIIYC